MQISGLLLFFPCHTYKETLWFQGDTIQGALQHLEEASPITIMGLHLSFLCKIMSGGVNK